ncbi:nucleoid-associated protein, partial [Chromobacterium vaccinii]|uniref:nucleoid-associated protein n=1 Tax=Chromobacterium vaccinii TaxID=1108595 RepID=UPI001E4F0667
MNLDLSAISIDKVVIHTIKKRTEEKKWQHPGYGSKILTLPATAVTAFEIRLTEALSNNSHGTEVSIIKDHSDSLLAVSAKMMHAKTDEAFLEESKLASEKLAQAQEKKDLAASKLLIVTGKTGKSRNRYLALIKAEYQDGFTETKQGIEHLTELFLTQAQKLYKIGFFVETVSYNIEKEGLKKDNYNAFIFDHQMNETQDKSPAHYFYNIFLGTDTITSDKSLTKKFYEETVTYINSAPIEQNVKVELLEALRVELRNKNGTILIQGFAENNFEDQEIIDGYLD